MERDCALVSIVLVVPEYLGIAPNRWIVACARWYDPAEHMSWQTKNPQMVHDVGQIAMLKDS